MAIERGADREIASSRRAAAQPRAMRLSRLRSLAWPAASPAPTTSRRSGRTCAKAANRSRLLRDDELDPCVPRALRDDPRYVQGARRPRRRREVRRGLLRHQPARSRADGSAAAHLPRDLLGMPRARAATCPIARTAPVGVFGGMYNATLLPAPCQHAPRPDRQARRVPGDARQREGLRRDARRAQAEPHRPRDQRPHRLLDLARRGRAGASTRCATGSATWRWRAARRSPARRASGYLYQEGAMLSPDGHTRRSTPTRSGTVFSDGAAVVLLKRLSRRDRRRRHRSTP